MKRLFARWLRSFAQWLDPQASVIELRRINQPIFPTENPQCGFPIYYWQSDDNTFVLWPAPAGKIALCYRIVPIITP